MAESSRKPVAVALNASTPPRWLLLRTQIARYANLLKRHWWILPLTTLLGLGVASIVVSKSPPSYISNARMMVSGRVNIAEGNSGYTEELMNFFGTQIELMQSGEVRNRALARVQALYPDLPVVPAELSVGQQPRASIFTFRVIASDGPFAQYFLDACLEEYIRIKREMRTEKAGTTLAALGEEIASVEREWRGTEDEVLRFQEKNNLGYLKEEGNSAALYLASLNRQMADLKTEHQLLQTLDLEQNLDRQPRRAEPAEALGGTQDPFLFATGPGADFLKARQQLRLLQADREQLSEYMRPKHPDIVRLDEEIGRLARVIEGFRKQAAEQLASRRDGIQVQMANLSAVVKEWEEKAVELSRRIAEYEKLRSKLDRLKGQYDRLFSSARALDVTRSVDQDTISVLERASPPASIRPGLSKTITAGLVGGFLIGCLILFIMDRLDDRLTSVLDVQMHFTEHVLGQVMHEKNVGKLQLLQADDPRHGFAESFRNLRSSLLYLPFEGERPKVILVTSAIPNEGKSTVSSNLAVALSMSGAKVLLVDGDLRRGAQHRQFGLANDAGFSEVIRGLVNWSEVVLPTSFENLSLIPRGHAITDGSERLLGHITDNFLKEVYPHFDHIIIDSSPVLVADDTTSFAPKTDAVICVLRFNHSSGRLSRRVIELLKHRQANVIGLVINDVDSSTPEYGYYKYKDYYKTASTD